MQDALAQTSSDAADEAAQLDALFGEAQADAAAGDLDAAARKLQVLRAARPKDGDVRSLFDEVQARRTGQKRRDVGLNVTTRTALQARLEERDWDGAEAVLRERLQEQRDSADVHLHLALVLLHGKDTPRAALPHAREAVALSPDRADARVVLADLLGKTGQRQASQEARAVATQLAEDQELNLNALRIELASPFQEAGRVGEGPSTVAAAPPAPAGARALRLARARGAAHRPRGHRGRRLVLPAAQARRCRALRDRPAHPRRRADAQVHGADPGGGRHGVGRPAGEHADHGPQSAPSHRPGQRL